MLHTLYGVIVWTLVLVYPNFTTERTKSENAILSIALQSNVRQDRAQEWVIGSSIGRVHNGPFDERARKTGG